MKRAGFRPCTRGCIRGFETVGARIARPFFIFAAPANLNGYNNNVSRGRAKGHRGDRKAPICNRRQGRKALTGEPPRPPSSREGDRPQAVEGVPAHRAPITLRPPSRNPLYNPGCRVATLLVSTGVMGFLGDLREDRSRARPVGGSARRSIPSEREQPCCDL